MIFNLHNTTSDEHFLFKNVLKRNDEIVKTYIRFLMQKCICQTYFYYKKKNYHHEKYMIHF